jgi:hypothetical protein
LAAITVTLCPGSAIRIASLRIVAVKNDYQGATNESEDQREIDTQIDVSTFKGIKLVVISEQNNWNQ